MAGSTGHTLPAAFLHSLPVRIFPPKRKRLNGNDRSQVHALLLCLVSSLSLPALTMADFNTFSDPEGKNKKQQPTRLQRTNSYLEGGSEVQWKFCMNEDGGAPPLEFL